MTEEEAETKWCPFVRAPLAGGDDFAGNATTLDGRSIRVGLCVGSGCMAWRWRDRDASNKPLEARVGYCGLAGAPQ